MKNWLDNPESRDIYLRRFRALCGPADAVTGCIEWQGVTNGHYGRFTLEGRKEVAHRARWLMEYGFIGLGLRVLHKCDNRKCVNIRHLFLGTMSDNTRDCVAKGRWKQAKKPYKLQPHEVIAIKSLRGILSQRAIARRFNISQGHVKNLQLNRGWL